MINLRELIWPILEPSTVDQKAVLEADVATIRAQTWTKEATAALSEARRLTEAEADRRKTTDVKASTYLAAIGVFTTILASSAPTIADAKRDVGLRLASGAILGLAVAYLIAAGVWAFRTLRVSAATRVDVSDLLTAWSRPKPKAVLISELFAAVRHNHDSTNAKLTRLKMTEEFLLRAFITVAALLVLQIVWLGGDTIRDAIHPPPKTDPMAATVISSTTFTGQADLQGLATVSGTIDPQLSTSLTQCLACPSCAETTAARRAKDTAAKLRRRALRPRTQDCPAAANVGPQIDHQRF